MTKHRNIVIVTNLSVPNGMAGTNRLLSMARGMHANNYNITVIVLNPTESPNNINNYQNSGNYKGVHYKYLSKSTILPKSFIKKLWIFIQGLFALLPYLKKLHRDTPLDAIMILHTLSIYPLVLYFFTRRNKIVFIQERSEYPFLNTNSILKKIDYYIYKKIILKLFDGLLLITENLLDYFKSLTPKKTKLLCIPMTVEPDRFGNKKEKREEEYIAYCGYMWGNKDGVPVLIDSFAKISKNFPKLKLYLIGDTSNKNEFDILKKKIKSLNIEKQVVFTGRVERDEMPELLDNAKLLALARPTSIQAQGGFPTKLGEYLATGNPVVVTKVGEIPDYLTDKINAFLAEPDSSDNFAQKLSEALNDSQYSAKIGERGKILAQTTFNYKVQGANIISFINTLKRK